MPSSASSAYFLWDCEHTAAKASEGLREARSCTVELPDNPTTPARHD